MELELGEDGSFCGEPRWDEPCENFADRESIPVLARPPGEADSDPLIGQRISFSN